MSYDIYLVEDSTGAAENVKKRLSVADANDFILLNRSNLKNGQRYIIEDSKGNIDMEFTKNNVITPRKSKRMEFFYDDYTPYYFTDDLKQSTKKSMAKPKMNKMKNSGRDKKSRGKWIGNMFKLSSSRLKSITRSGTPKQKSLAQKILKNRKK